MLCGKCFDEEANLIRMEQLTPEEASLEDLQLRAYADAEFRDPADRSLIFCSKFEYDQEAKDFMYVRSDGSLTQSWTSLHEPTRVHEQYQKLPTEFIRQSREISEILAHDEGIARAYIFSPAVRADGLVHDANSDRSYITEVIFTQSPDGVPQIVTLHREGPRDAVDLASFAQSLIGETGLSDKTLKAGDTGFNLVIERGAREHGDVLQSKLGEGEIYLLSDGPIYDGPVRYINPLTLISNYSVENSDLAFVIDQQEVLQLERSEFRIGTDTSLFLPSPSHERFADNLIDWSNAASATQHPERLLISNDEVRLPVALSVSELFLLQQLGETVAHPMQISQALPKIADQFSESSGSNGEISVGQRLERLPGSDLNHNSTSPLTEGIVVETHTPQSKILEPDHSDDIRSRFTEARHEYEHEYETARARPASEQRNDNSEGQQYQKHEDSADPSFKSQSEKYSASENEEKFSRVVSKEEPREDDRSSEKIETQDEVHSDQVHDENEVCEDQKVESVVDPEQKLEEEFDGVVSKREDSEELSSEKISHANEQAIEGTLIEH